MRLLYSNKARLWLFVVLVLVAVASRFQNPVSRESIVQVRCEGVELESSFESLFSQLEMQSRYVTQSGLTIFDGQNSTVRFGFRDSVCRYIAGRYIEVTDSESVLKLDDHMSPSEIHNVLGDPDEEFLVGSQLIQAYNFRHLDLRLEVLLVARERYNFGGIPVGKEWFIGSYHLFRISSRALDGLSNRHVP